MRSKRHRRGAVSESRVISKLMEMGFSVSVPFEEEKYDIVADYNGNILRVQVKRIFKDDGLYAVELRSQTANTEGTYKKDYDDSEFDVFVFHNPYLEQFYWVWPSYANRCRFARTEQGWQEYLIQNQIKVKDEISLEEDSNNFSREEIEGSVFDC